MGTGFRGLGCAHRLHSSSCWGYIFRILRGNPKKGTTMEPIAIGKGVLG